MDGAPARVGHACREGGRVVNATEYGAHLASMAPPITDEQAEAAARILATVDLSAAA